MDFSDSFDDLFPKGALSEVLNQEHEEDQDEALPRKERKVWSVSELLFHINSLLDLEYGTLWIEGEVGQVTVPSSGHYYFNLKDDRGLLRSVCFRSSHGHFIEHIQEGASVLCLARVNVYKARGDLQIVVEYVEPWGEGRLKLEFERLKERLGREGLFRQEKKREIPAWPGTIFVVTSPSGAAFRDFLKTARAKFPPARIVLVPSMVQGEDAPKSLLEALDLAEEAAGEGDVIVLTRGGGSMEDLWAFNHEALARRIYDCNIPVVSGVGHEVDFTICDFVSDKRAATPTAAAELVCPSASVLLERVREAETRLRRQMDHLILEKRHSLALLASRLKHPRGALTERRLRLDDILGKMSGAMERCLSQKERGLSGLSSRLSVASPLSRLQTLAVLLNQNTHQMRERMRDLLHLRKEHYLKLDSRLRASGPGLCFKRGFALVVSVSTGEVLTDASKIGAGEEVEVRLKRGALLCRVTDVKEVVTK